MHQVDVTIKCIAFDYTHFVHLSGNRQREVLLREHLKLLIVLSCDGFQKKVIVSPEHELELALAETQLELALPIEILATVGFIVVIVANVERKVDHFHLTIWLDEVDASLNIRD